MQPLPSEVGFADSTFLRYLREGTRAVVELRAWNERTLRITFEDVVLMFDRVTDELSAVIISADPENERLTTALAWVYESKPQSHPYRVYAFLDVDGNPAMEVVAARHVVEVI